MTIAALVLWAVLLIAAAFYTKWARHPDAKPLAAFMIFVIVFSVFSFVVFATLAAILQALGRTEILTNPAVAILFLLVVFVPAFLVARWQLRRPPHRFRRL